MVGRYGLEIAKLANELAAAEVAGVTEETDGGASVEAACNVVIDLTCMCDEVPCTCN